VLNEQGFEFSGLKFGHPSDRANDVSNFNFAIEPDFLQLGTLQLNKTLGVADDVMVYISGTLHSESSLRLGILHFLSGAIDMIMFYSKSRILYLDSGPQA
jgi:hypothetical protein